MEVPRPVHSRVMRRATTMNEQSCMVVRRGGMDPVRFTGASPFALKGAFCGWPGRGERLLRAKLFRGGEGAGNQVQSRAEYRCTLLSSSAISQ